MEGLYGNYRAKVIDNSTDPLKAGRVKIRVYGVHDSVKESALPWAQYADSTMMGSLFVPDKGSDVWVFFEMGDINQPVFFAAAPNKPNVPDKAQTNYPSNRVIKTKSGITIEFNDSDKSIKITTDGLINLNSSDVVVNSPKIQLGESGSVEQSVLGKQLETWINTHLLEYLNTHTHTSGSSGTPTTVPIVPFTAGTASPSGQLYSKKNTNQ